MARKRIRDFELPSRVYKHGNRYRYVPKVGQPISLGKTVEEALVFYDGLMQNPDGVVAHVGPLSDERLYNLLSIHSLARPIYNGPGVYFLFKGSNLVYVGQSAQVMRRIGEQVRIRQFDSMAIIRCSREKLLELEASYIDFLKSHLKDQRILADPATRKKNNNYRLKKELPGNSEVLPEILEQNASD